MIFTRLFRTAGRFKHVVLEQWHTVRVPIGVWRVDKDPAYGRKVENLPFSCYQHSTATDYNTLGQGAEVLAVRQYIHGRVPRFWPYKCLLHTQYWLKITEPQRDITKHLHLRLGLSRIKEW